MRKSAGAIVILTMAAAIPNEAQTNYDTVQVRTVPLTHTVYLLQGGGGNILVSAGSDAVFAVDAQYPQSRDKSRQRSGNSPRIPFSSWSTRTGTLITSARMRTWGKQVRNFARTQTSVAA